MAPRTDWILDLYDQLDGAGPEKLAPGLDGGRPGPIAAVLARIKETPEMNLQNALASASVGSGAVGIIAQAIPGIPSDVSWSFVVLSTVPCLALLIRAVYSYGIRRIESRERLAMIEKGITPPVLPLPGPIDGKAPTGLRQD